ncbi:ABC transporter substrate-binding protein [Rhizobium halophytocola]|uniref:Peptide/nickel transport system substrate-binding protein n=1 Tax=Rhizobium halophytocola TaxID=735519 RepID=A0ABS4DSH2_9HYPH|nr:ABC transporter substrate-binding protein [Rhizobium halophytocola]MBP1848640.1 peptide/nickel transport system substrate-binding protein [Rhizobium halophytocola]
MKTFARAALTAALVLSAGVSAHAIERGGTLTYGRYADSLFLDPVLNDANVDIWILSNLYDTLLLPTDDGKDVKPGLASEYKMADDGMSIALTLRDGIKFSDGSPITASDVVWSLKRATKKDNGIWGFMVDSIDDIVADGDTKVTIKLKHPDPAILAALTVFNTAIMPQKAFEAAKGTTDEEKAKDFGTHPVGSGAFMLKSWDRGSVMKLVKNPYYWAKGEDGQPLPYLDEVDFPVIPDDATRILKLGSGELDGAEFIPYSRVAELKGSAAVDMELFPSTRVQYVTMNVRPEIDGKKNPLSDVKVRQAMNYAINKQAIIQIVTHGVGTPQTSYMSTATPLHAGDQPLYPYDLEKAKSLMKESGYPDGFSTSILVLAGNQDQISISTALQQMLGQIGVKLDLQQVDNATLTQQYREGKFVMRNAAWTDDIADPNEITSYFAYSPNIDALHTGWNSEEADTLFEASQKEMDGAKRAEEYARIQEIFNTTGPTLPLYETPYPVALSKKVHGFLQIPLGNNIFSGAWKDK